MIYFFAYFWTTVQFQPKEMANQLRDYGSFIPGLRPASERRLSRTGDDADHLRRRRVPVHHRRRSHAIIQAQLNIPFQITAFLGGTGLLIVVSVALDMVQRIEANLLMRNYGGFLGGGKRTGTRQDESRSRAKY